MKKRPRQAVLYARFSPRPNAAESESIPWQLERLRAWCQSRDLAVAGEYTDVAKTGRTIEGRKGLQEAVEHVCNIRGILVVYDLSRLARKTLDALLLAERIRRRKAELMMLTDQIDTSTPMGEFAFAMKASVAQLMRQETAAKTKDAMLRHQAAGRRMGRPDHCPFGRRPSRDDPKTLEDDPEEQQVIAKILELDRAGIPARGICRELDRLKILRRGKTWEKAHRLVGLILKRQQGNADG